MWACAWQKEILFEKAKKIEMFTYFICIVIDSKLFIWVFFIIVSWIINEILV